ncbi:MAG: SGNH/GDSL hydrolase family protein [Planctomycetes bacterium]|nr:SGNH/GDSL hydrolase family protein [Planctomycetota bacterium]MCB9920005.1 SGNH/GDSL hydrolase family protein [Planctomycetota bacterium]
MNVPPFPQLPVLSDRQIEHDPVLCHRFVAGIQRRVPHESGAYFVRTNREGFREDHDLVDVISGRHVLCFGDSYAAGDGVDNERRFTALAGARLGLTISNVAVPGYGPDQNVLQLERLAWPPADLLLWCIAVHTMDRIQTSERFATNREGRLSRVGRSHFVLKDDGELELLGVPVEPNGVPVRESFPAIESPLRGRLRLIAGGLRSRLASAIGPYVKPPPDPDYADATSAGWRLMAALVKRFHSSASGTPVVVVPLPTSRYLTEPHRPHFQERFAEVEDIAHGLHVLDVVTALRRLPHARKRGLCFTTDGHYTEEGHRAVADALVQQFEQRGLVAQAKSGLASQQTSTRRLTSDGSVARRTGMTLEVSWNATTASARVLDPARAVVAERDEVTITGRGYRLGTVPLSAVHACLDDAKLAGPELHAIRLRSACTVGELAAIAPDRRDPAWFELAAGWVRWRGAAARDLRVFLCFERQIEERDETITTEQNAREVSSQAATHADSILHIDGDLETDEEAIWLRSQLGSAQRIRDPNELFRLLNRLARRWDLATRAARTIVLPSSAPLRRGRLA